jgi:hypothetical protein
MALQPVAEGVWISEAPVSFLGLRLTATMTVLRLADDSLLVHSPVPLTPERKSAVDSLGQVSHLYSPNTYHHLRLGDWSAAYPKARVHAPRGLAKKRPEVRIDRFHRSMTEPAFEGVVDEIGIDGFRLEESVLFYRPARTLIVADLVHNIGRPTHPWTRLYTRAAGFYDRVALSRVIRLAAFSDRRAARRSLGAGFDLPFDRVVVGHGAPIVEDAHQVFESACAWLRPA